MIRVLDLFCGAGGCSVGYHRGFTAAGFDVEIVGVDHRPQPNYPYAFVQADAMTFPLDGFDLIHASPPCQAYTAYRRTGNVSAYPDVVAATRERLASAGSAWIIENVPGAPLDEPVLICGSMFDPPMNIRRHRLFESNVPLAPPAWPCRHKLVAPDRFPGGRSKQRTGSSRGLVRATIEIGSWDVPVDAQREAMGIDWMTLDELSEAIPPEYTRFLAEQIAPMLAKEAA